ncbi:MAG: UDP-N-acetylmuramoyl-L-alanyl-D-glutamate--2,6-diaminopimelate ligase [Oscillospiraceae bacterium]|nr:UDP-N-acetylmuramoyl-L-alanyl-D-glutamate--2,6-diaminopimelate ligase [Oscillospiraceae bacterium]
MKLSELLKDISNYTPAKAEFNTACEVYGITDNSKELKEGYIFVCVKGEKFDGHSVAEEMLEQGAVCVFTERDLKLKNQIIVSNTRQVYGLLCAAWFGHPEKRLKLIGITGTNGKTTMATLIKEILMASGKKAGFIGTTGVLINDRPFASDQSTPTTPRAYELYSIFQEMVKKHCEYVVMEVSSFALEQHRIGPAIFETAVFTNLTQDHLDYHKDMENYYQAKKKLFTEHCKTAVVNVDAPYGPRLWEDIAGCSCERISYSIDTPASVRASDVRYSDSGVKFWITVNEKSYPVALNMIGRFNVYNALAAIIVCLKANMGIKNTTTVLAATKGVKGRCEVLDKSRGFKIICDYAHSSDALENMLSSVKHCTRGRLICLFGCGGNRDSAKRPLMAQAAEKYSDVIVLTSDNPRDEDPEAILDDIACGLSGLTPYMRIADRRTAIRRAIYFAEPGDTVVLAGKGHEDYQVLANDEHIRFDEREIVKNIMLNYKKLPFRTDVSESLTITEIVDILGGKPVNLHNLSASVDPALFFSDSRNIVKKGVFFALKGENFDGHDYAAAAVKEGALFAVAEHEIDANTPCIIVKSVRKALLELARYFRMKFNPILVGITGSVGKTTTKNMTALALSASHSVYKTPANHNNEIGLPFTLFKLNSSCTAAVIEMGMSHEGEIERLSRTSVPDICLITNIGESHIENFENREGILHAKMEIIKGSKKGAPIILNGDDEYLSTIINDYSGSYNIVSYGIENKNCDFTAEDIKTFEDRMYFNVYHHGIMITDVALFCSGKHNISNALAAIAVAVTAKADPVAAADMLSGFQPDSLRSCIKHKGTNTLIIDCYNAAPVSMKAAIDTLCDMTPKEGGRRVAVLGDMRELGSRSAEYHREIGEYAVNKGIDLLVCLGNDAKNIAERATELGLKSASSTEKQTILNFLKFKIKPNDIILFKASRAVHLEEVVDQFFKE